MLFIWVATQWHHTLGEQLFLKPFLFSMLGWTSFNCMHQAKSFFLTFGSRRCWKLFYIQTHNTKYAYIDCLTYWKVIFFYFITYFYVNSFFSWLKSELRWGFLCLSNVKLNRGYNFLHFLLHNDFPCGWRMKMCRNGLFR